MPRSQTQQSSLNESLPHKRKRQQSFHQYQDAALPRLNESLPHKRRDPKRLMVRLMDLAVRPQ